uniref:Uncharacterized protein n=1 Tax=Nelumbo nucifera TaxID=4432 RepID=A0A822Y9D9_NELNU|nr:TPA_asm: hypothetical protein HUJ06_029103 [Nelumbo nucifera]
MVVMHIEEIKAKLAHEQTKKERLSKKVNHLTNELQHKEAELVERRSKFVKELCWAKAHGIKKYLTLRRRLVSSMFPKLDTTKVKCSNVLKEMLE